MGRRHRHGGRWCLALGLVVFLGAVPAGAGEPSAADRETARALMDRGYPKLDRGDAAGALADFQGADAIMGVSSTGLAVGKALEKLGRLIEARDKLLAVTRLPVKTGETDALALARAEADKLQLGIADRIPSIALVIKGGPLSGAVSVTVDGVVVPAQTQSLPRKVDPGRHVVAATAPGFDRVEQPLSIAEGERREVVLTLTASTAPPSPPPPPSERGLSTWAWVGGGIAAAGLVVGSITGGLSLAAAAAAKEGCKGNVCPKANEPDADRSLALAHTSTASFVLAAAGGGLLVYGLVFDRPEPVQKRAARLRTRPLVGPGWVGLDAAF